MTKQLGKALTGMKRRRERARRRGEDAEPLTATALVYLVSTRPCLALGS